MTKEDLEGMSISDKITLLEHIKKNYSDYKKVWTRDKVLWLENEVLFSVRKLALFEPDNN